MCISSESHNHTTKRYHQKCALLRLKLVEKMLLKTDRDVDIDDWIEKYGKWIKTNMYIEKAVWLLKPVNGLA